MFKKDYLLRELEKLLDVIAKLNDLKSADNKDAFITLADNTLIDEYNITLSELLEIQPEEFELELNQRNYNADKLDALANLLYLFAEPFTVNEETLAILKKILIIFDKLETRHARQSFENIIKRNSIGEFIKRAYE